MHGLLYNWKYFINITTIIFYIHLPKENQTHSQISLTLNIAIINILDPTQYY